MKATIFLEKIGHRN